MAPRPVPRAGELILVFLSITGIVMEASLLRPPSPRPLARNVDEVAPGIVANGLQSGAAVPLSYIWGRIGCMK
jgi:hypothetical protein